MTESLRSQKHSSATDAVWPNFGLLTAVVHTGRQSHDDAFSNHSFQEIGGRARGRGWRRRRGLSRRAGWRGRGRVVHDRGRRELVVVCPELAVRRVRGRALRLEDGRVMPTGWWRRPYRRLGEMFFPNLHTMAGGSPGLTHTLVSDHDEFQLRPPQGRALICPPTRGQVLALTQTRTTMVTWGRLHRRGHRINKRGALQSAYRC